MWLSLISTPSPRFSRWFLPPPAATAYLSSARSPGAVLRVSRIWALVPLTASTYFDVNVAIPLMRCRKLSAVRSAIRILARLPVTVPAHSPLSTAFPSYISSTVSSVASTLRNTAIATGRPASTPLSCATSLRLAGCMGRYQGGGGYVAVAQVLFQGPVDHRLQHTRRRQRRGRRPVTHRSRAFAPGP